MPRSLEDDELFLQQLDYRRDRLHAAMLAHTCTFPDEWLDRRELSAVGLCKNAADLVRCSSGNPFHPVTIDPTWLACNESTIPKSALYIYQERTFDHLPILADALDEAGCTNADILDHCRQTGEHVRGCWVVDLILGKE